MKNACLLISKNITDTIIIKDIVNQLLIQSGLPKDHGMTALNIFPATFDSPELYQGIVSALQTDGYNVQIASDSIFTKSKSDGRDILLMVWDGKETQSISVALSYQRMGKPVYWKMFDPNNESLWTKANLGEIDAITICTCSLTTTYKNKVYGNLGFGLGAAATFLEPTLRESLGSKLDQFKNGVFILGKIGEANIINLPVQPATITVNQDKSNLREYYRNSHNPGDVAPGYCGEFDLNMFKDSLTKLATLIEEQGWKNLVFSPPYAMDVNLFSIVIPTIMSHEGMQKFIEKLYIYFPKKGLTPFTDLSSYNS